MEFGGLAAPLGAMEAQVRRTLEPSVRRCDDMDDVIAQLNRGEAICWLVTDGDQIIAAAMTELRREGGLQCFIRHCAGKGVKDWIHFIAGIEAWARWFGCDSIALGGRTGWARKLGWDWHGDAAVKVL